MAVEVAMEFVNNTLVPTIETLAMEVGMAVLIITLCVACMTVYVLWWKGIPVARIVYATKHDVKTHCSMIMDHLTDNLSKLAELKKMSMDKFMNMETKLDENNTVSREIRDNVILLREDINRMHNKIDILNDYFKILDDKLAAVERNQVSGLVRIKYLCDFVDMYGGGLDEQKNKNATEELRNKVNNFREDLSFRDDDLKYMSRMVSSLENAATGRTTSKQ